jgi:hypothetical protein
LRIIENLTACGAQAASLSLRGRLCHAIARLRDTHDPGTVPSNRTRAEQVDEPSGASQTMQGSVMLGYMRVSKADGSQTTDLQRDALIAAGVEPERIYEVHASGKCDNRPRLAACLKGLCDEGLPDDPKAQSSPVRPRPLRHEIQLIK